MISPHFDTIVRQSSEPFTFLSKYAFSSFSDNFPPSFYGIEARHPLSLCGHTVILENERLSKALSLLERKKQEIVFLYFFKHYTYQEIAGYYGQAHSSVWSRMKTVMKQLKGEMGKQE